MILGPDFNKDIPIKSSTSFVEDKPSQAGTFVSDKPIENNHVFEGDNTAASVYGGDFGSFGGFYGEGNFGGSVHFLNRSDLPVINH